MKEQQFEQDTGKKPADVLIDIVIQFLLAVVVGLVMAVVANSFVEGARWFLNTSRIDSFIAIQLGDHVFKLDIYITLGIAAVLIFLVRRMLGITVWSGPADSIYAVQQSREPLDVRVGMGSTIAAFVVASGGGSVGQYGPLVHFGATMIEILLKYIRININRRVFIACGVAGAISAGFNAPIAGVLFAHEALLRRLSIGAIAPTAVTSIVAYAANQAFFVIEPTFSVPDMSIELRPLIPYLIMTAILSTGSAIAYMVAIRKGRDLAGQSGWSMTQLMCSCVLVVGTVGVFLPDVTGLGLVQVNQMIGAEFNLGMLLILLFAKIFVTAYCLNAGFFGGVFGPALFVGASTGAIAAYLAIATGLDPHLSFVLPVAAIAAVGGAVIGAPLTVIMIVIELTGSYAYGLSAMLCVILCSILTMRFFGLSYFDRQLLDRGIDLSLGQEHIELSLTPVQEIQGGEFVRLSQQTSVAEARQALIDAQATEAYVCDDHGQLLGKINIHSLTHASSLEQVMDDNPTTLAVDDNLSTAMTKASTFVGESIPVIDNGKLVDALSEGDIFNKVLQIQAGLRQQ
ncbi:MAG: chloride channel protein [Marinibacterium sp.]|nr:chloride channel protein [Marinibacterium sp.]